MKARFGGALLVSTIGLLIVACTASTSDDVVIATRPDASAPTFGQTDASASPDAKAVGLCATDECPANHATCPHSAFPCTDLSNDDNNCGGCGIVCPDLSQEGSLNLHGAMHCVAGKCALTCDGTLYADCNGFVEDGCEAFLFDDTSCTACGNVCASTHACRATMGDPSRGCECDIPDSCGACGNICPPSTDPPFPEEWNAGRGCAGGQCNKPGCLPGYGDCNNDLNISTGNGCETPTLEDPMNCGKCGQACLVGEGEVCQLGVCTCPCGAPCSQKSLNTDVLNCGACGFVCPSAELGKDDHATSQCVDGTCRFRCSANWGDCDGNNFNGCETDLGSDPMNCGGCGIRCEGVPGQACIDGACNTKECTVQ